MKKCGRSPAHLTSHSYLQRIYKYVAVSPTALCKRRIDVKKVFFFLFHILLFNDYFLLPMNCHAFPLRSPFLPSSRMITIRTMWFSCRYKKRIYIFLLKHLHECIQQTRLEFELLTPVPLFEPVSVSQQAKMCYNKRINKTMRKMSKAAEYVKDDENLIKLKRLIWNDVINR